MRTFSSLLVALAILGAGCTPKPSDKLVGMWKVDLAGAKTGDAKMDAALAPMLAQMTIDIKSDKTFTMGTGDQGTCAINDKAITFTITKPAGADAKQADPAGKTVTATLSADETSFSVNNPNGKAMVFKKAAS